MSEQEATKGRGMVRELIDELPTDQLVKEVESFMSAVAQRAVATATDKVGNATEKLTSYAGNGGGPAAKATVAGAKALSKGKPLSGLLNAGLSGVTGMIGKSSGSGGNSGGKKLKVTNIVEQIDIGVPLKLTYDLWTQFQEFPTFMKKVETVSQEEDEKLTWKAQVLWSHRTWRSTIIEQIPDERIVWQSEGDQGYVDGAVTFHALTPDLTRVLVVLEYHPAGLIEGTGNLWRAQGRRVRLELKHFRRHIMTQAVLHPDEIEGWRGEIRDGQVVSADGEEPQAADEDLGPEEEEAEETGSRDEDRGDEDEYDEDEDEYAADAEDEYEDEDHAAEPDEYADEGEDQEPDRAKGRDGDDDTEEQPRRRQRMTAGRR